MHFAADVINSGGIIAYPTEAVWGLGCHVDNAEGVDRILQLKQRSVSRGLILVAADIQQFAPYLKEIEPALIQKMQASWPGPTTWLVPNNFLAPAWISGDHNTLALRVSAHPFVAALCRRVGGAIVSTSANPQAKIAARTAQQVRQYFPQGLDHISAGKISGDNKPSQIKNLLTDEIIR